MYNWAGLGNLDVNLKLGGFRNLKPIHPQTYLIKFRTLSIRVGSD